ncbi:DUF2071 domain-containing protein [uncultured Pseudokineococcus sp.]|uniref:DUF2071 domain-containing protein n=1 Tax=uncultured Pseudokineococcus sp. TaxID=1642928 RepID=UPI002613CB00|nr:DUF2071 domain-containing protein [uncultured Pseudokineococcus sp.]
MRAPVLSAEVERRLLLTWRADPDVVTRPLPQPFRPQLVDGAAVVGVCCIRLGAVSPRGLPAAVGLRAENAAHRVAVAWDGPDGERTGVWVRQRHTGSRLVALAGGRLFPGLHGRARFDVAETAQRVRVGVTADGGTSPAADVEVVPELVGSALLADLDAASRFVETGSTGWSAAPGGRGPAGTTGCAWRPAPGAWRPAAPGRCAPACTTTRASTRPAQRSSTTRWSCAACR